MRLELDRYYAEGCVLQRGAPVTVRGRAVPGARVRVELPGGAGEAVADAAGSWEAVAGPPAAGGPHTLRVSCGAERLEIGDVWVGDVWVCLGQSNMAFTLAPVPPWTEGVPDHAAEIASAGDPLIRFLPLARHAFPEPMEQVGGRWVGCVAGRTGPISAVAYHMARRLRELEDVPVGMIIAAVGSTGISSWISEAAGRRWPDVAERLAERDRLLAKHHGRMEAHRAEIEEYREAFARAVARGELPPNEGPALHDGQLFAPGGCHNALVAPLMRHPVAGWVWYQGESNVTRADAYGERLKVLIGEYRERWGQPRAPFIVVQLPGYEPAPAGEAGTGRTGATWAWLREQQRRVVMETPGTALVATLDAGDARRIHPRNKRPVGRRCADAARALQEGREPWLAPARAERHGAGAVAIRFSRPLAPQDMIIKPGCAFELPDAAGGATWADCAAVRDGRLVVAHPAAALSREIRYAFRNNPAPALFDRSGTPVTPFRLEIEP